MNDYTIDIDVVLNESDEEMESANYHGWIGVSRDLYNAIKEYVSPVYHGELAVAIAKTIAERI